MKMLAIALLAIDSAFLFLESTAGAENACDSPQVISSLGNQVRNLGSSNPDWVVRMGLWIPYFRMKEAEISIVSIRTKGPARTGLDCEADLRIMPPPDMRATTKGVLGRFGYVIMPKPNGGFEIDLY